MSDGYGWGYVSFAHYLLYFVCMCVNVFFFVKDFSGTTASTILKFGTNVGYDLLYCVRENQLPPAYHSLYLSFFLSLQFSVIDFSAPMTARIFKFCIHLERGQVYCGKEN